MQSRIFTCRHKVIKRTCGPKLPRNVFSSPNRPEKVLNGIPQMFGISRKKDHLGLEKSMLTKYGVWDTWDDFSFFTPKKNDILRTGTYRYVPLRTNCRMVRTSTYLYIPVRTCTYRYVQSVQYVPVRTGMYQYIHNVRTGTYWYVPVRKKCTRVTWRYVPMYVPVRTLQCCLQQIPHWALVDLALDTNRLGTGHRIES